MTVLQPGSEGVQSAVIVYGKPPVIGFHVFKQMPVSIKQPFYFENLLQFVQDPSFLVQFANILPVLFRKGVSIAGQPLVMPFIRTGVNSTFPADLANVE